jgi:hypothetical protein
MRGPVPRFLPALHGNSHTNLGNQTGTRGCSRPKRLVPLQGTRILLFKMYRRAQELINWFLKINILKVFCKLKYLQRYTPLPPDITC